MGMARNVWLGNMRRRFAHCHDLLIGETGITHKGTSIDRAVSIIRRIRPSILILNNISSIEGVLEQMQDLRQSTALIAAGEYSYLVATSKRQGTSNILPVLNDAYDGKNPLTITKKRAPIIDNPFVNLVAGCTPDWVAKYADEEGANLGRFNRYVVFSTEQNRDLPEPDDLSPDEEEGWARQFGETLDKLIKEPNAMEFELRAREHRNEWFFEHRRRLRSLPDNLRKLLHRADDQVNIQAMMYAMDDGQRVIELDHTRSAIALIDWSNANKLRLFGEVELTQDQRLEQRMQAFIDRGAGTIVELYRYLGRLGTREAVYRKLKAFVPQGICRLSRPLDQPSRELLRIYPPG
jgi:hypothetical protein